MARYKIPGNERSVPMDDKGASGAARNPPERAWKIVKLNKPSGTSVLATARQRRRARRTRNANRAKSNDAGAGDLLEGQRSSVTNERPYAREVGLPRSVGRVTGVTTLGLPTARADLLKQGKRPDRIDRS